MINNKNVDSKIKHQNNLMMVKIMVQLRFKKVAFKCLITFKTKFLITLASAGFGD